MRLIGKPLILMYHRIADTTYDPWGLAVSPDRFEAQLLHLKKYWDVIPLEEFGTLFSQGRLPRKAVALTFDDGYACNALVAAPMLKALNIPATFFLVTGAIGENREFWWDELAMLVVEAGAEIAVHGRTVEVSVARIEIPSATLKTWTWLRPVQHPRLQHYMALWHELRRMDQSERRHILDCAWQRIGLPAHARPEYRPMTRDEAVTLGSSDLLDVAPHTLTHPELAHTERDSQVQEIAGSLMACRRLCPGTKAVFSYPHGSFSLTTKQIVREAGFQIACGTQGTAVGRKCDLFALPRIQVTESTFRSLARAHLFWGAGY